MQTNLTVVTIWLGPAAEEPIYIAMQLPYEWNLTHCSPARRHSCSVVHIYTCVSFQASDFVFPPGRFVCLPSCSL